MSSRAGHAAIVAVALLSACGRVGFDSAGAGDANGPCTHLMCDDFEAPTLSRWGGAKTSNGSSVARDPAFGRTGASLHATGGSGSDIAAEFVDVFPATLPSDEYVRVYIYSASTGNLDCEPVEIANPGRNNQVVFSLYTDSFDIHAHGIAGEFNVTRQIAPPRDAWVCYELHVVIGASGTVELYQDGTLVVEKANVDTRPSSGDLARVHVGLPSKPMNVNEQLWFDDFAADTSPIGCN